MRSANDSRFPRPGSGRARPAAAGWGAVALRWMIWATVVAAVAGVVLIERRADRRAQAQQLTLQARHSAAVADDQVERVARRLAVWAAALTTAPQAAALATAPQAAASDTVPWQAAHESWRDQPAIRSLALLAPDGTITASTEPQEVGAQVRLQAWGIDPERAGAQVGVPLSRRGLVTDDAQLEAAATGRGQADRASTGSAGPVAVLMAHRVDAGTEPGWVVAVLSPPSLIPHGTLPATAGPSTSWQLQTLGETPLRLAAGGAPAPPEAWRLQRSASDMGGLELGAGREPAVLLGAAPLSTVSWALVAAVDSDRWDSAWWRQRLLALIGLAVAAAASALGPVQALRRCVADAARRGKGAPDAARARPRQPVAADNAPAALFSLDAAGVVVATNAYWTRLWRPGNDRVVGAALESLVVEDDRACVRRLLCADPRSGIRRARVRMPMWGTQGRTLELLLQPNAGGQGFSGLVVDVHDLCVERDHLARQCQRATALLEQLPLAWWLTDARGRFAQSARHWPRALSPAPRAAAGGVTWADLPAQLQQLHRAMDRVAIAREEAVEFESPWGVEGSLPRDTLVTKRKVVLEPQGPPMLLNVMVDLTDLRGLRGVAVADLSHELRTPLQTIVGFAELGSRRVLTSSDACAMFLDILAAGRRLIGRVEELLDASRMDAVLDHLQPQEVDLVAATEAAIRASARHARAKDVRVVFSRPPESAIVTADPASIGTVLESLVSMAIDETVPSACVVVDMRRVDAGDVVLGVIDGGRASAGRTHPAAVGLEPEVPVTSWAICRSLVQAHHGRLDRIALAGGSRRAEIRLPVQRWSVPAVDPAAASRRLRGIPA